jgi:hypothetical protein
MTDPAGRRHREGDHEMSSYSYLDLVDNTKVNEILRRLMGVLTDDDDETMDAIQALLCAIEVLLADRLGCPVCREKISIEISEYAVTFLRMGTDSLRSLVGSEDSEPCPICCRASPVTDINIKEKIIMDEATRKLPVEPLHVATINGHRLRFFRSPEGNTEPDRYLQEVYSETPDLELPDLPWISVEDWLSVMGVPADQHPAFLRSHAPPSRTVTIKDLAVDKGYPTPWSVPCTRTVAIADGIVVIAPEIITWALMSDIPRAPERTPVHPHYKYERLYEIANRAAVDKVTVGLSVNDLCSWLYSARQRRTRDYLASLMVRRDIAA